MVSNVYSTLGITSQYSAIFIFRSHNFTWKFQKVHSSISFSSSFFLHILWEWQRKKNFHPAILDILCDPFNNFPNIKAFSYFTLLTSLYRWSVLESCIRLILQRIQNVKFVRLDSTFFDVGNMNEDSIHEYHDGHPYLSLFIIRIICIITFIWITTRTDTFWDVINMNSYKVNNFLTENLMP